MATPWQYPPPTFDPGQVRAVQFPGHAQPGPRPGQLPVATQYPGHAPPAPRPGQLPVAAQYLGQSKPGPPQTHLSQAQNRYAQPQVIHPGHTYGAQHSNGHQPYTAAKYSAQSYQQQAYYQHQAQQTSSHLGPQQPVYAQAAYPVQQPVNVPDPPSNAKFNKHTCFNCGTPGHWAQECPHPRRQASSASSIQNNLAPAKRTRPGYVPPVITKYAVPEHIKQAHAARLGNPYQVQQPGTMTPTQYAQQQFSGFRPLNHANVMIPPTRVFAHSPAPYQPQPWPQGLEDSRQTPLPVQASYIPLASPHSSTNAQSAPPPPPPPPPPPESPVSQSGTPSWVATRSPLRRASAAWVAPQGTQSRAALRTVLTHDLEEADIDEKVRITPVSEDSLDEDDLTLLDVPDLPTEDPEIYGHKSCYLISAPLQGVSATDFSDLIAHASEETNDRICSKYIRQDTLGAMLQNIRHSEYFSKKQDDPIFQFSRANSPARPPAPPAPLNVPPKPPRIPLPPGYDARGYRQPQHDVMYKTVVNGPIEEIPRASTPIPEVDTDGPGSGEYDPYDPSASSSDYATNVLENGTGIEAASSSIEISAMPPSEVTTHKKSDGMYHLPVPPPGPREDRKRNFADTFPSSFETQPKRSTEETCKRLGLVRKKRINALIVNGCP